MVPRIVTEREKVQPYVGPNRGSRLLYRCVGSYSATTRVYLDARASKARMSKLR